MHYVPVVIIGAGQAGLAMSHCLTQHRIEHAVLERGQICESGRHSELLEQKGLYYAMWRQQVGEREAVAQGK